MQKSSNQREARELTVPDLDLPILTDAARRPPVLSMDQYFLANENDALAFHEDSAPPFEERCSVPFEL